MLAGEAFRARRGNGDRMMPDLTDEEIALLKYYLESDRIITGLHRSQAHQRLLKLSYIEERAANLQDLRITITDDGRHALLDHLRRQA
jgi:hypothetical protein